MHKPKDPHQNPTTQPQQPIRWQDVIEPPQKEDFEETIPEGYTGPISGKLAANFEHRPDFPPPHNNETTPQGNTHKINTTDPHTAQLDLSPQTQTQAQKERQQNIIIFGLGFSIVILIALVLFVLNK